MITRCLAWLITLSSSTLGTAACPGDLTGDGVVDIADLNDAIGAAVIDMREINLVLGNFHNRCESITAFAVGDAEIRDTAPSANFGDRNLACIGGTFSEGRMVITLDLSPFAVDPEAVISAEFRCNAIAGAGKTTYSVHPLLAPFDELGVSWSDAAAGTPWSVKGGDYASWSLGEFEQPPLGDIVVVPLDAELLREQLKLNHEALHLLIKRREPGGSFCAITRELHDDPIFSPRITITSIITPEASP